jgi:hypothetical protein
LNTRSLFLLIALNLWSFSYACSQVTIKGRVVQDKNKEPVPFVHIITDKPLLDTTTDIDGYFNLKVERLPIKLTFSSLGFEKKQVLITSDNSSFVTVVMTREGIKLDEVIILPGENPAHQYILAAIKNKQAHKPDSRPFYQCNTYNKFYYTLNPDKLEEYKEKNSNDNFENFIKNHHLFLMENVSQRTYKQPNKLHEKVLANRVSGIKNPNFIALSGSIQPFSFYDDELDILEKKYQNPLSKSAFRKYFYNIEDTLIHAPGDTTFLISYRPAKGKNFNALKGVLSINTKGFAIENVTAEPYFEELNRIKVHQQYQYDEQNGWFPHQLQAEILFSEFDLLLISKTYVTDVRFEETGKWKHGNVVLEIDEEAGVFADKLLLEYRADSLTEKDLKTYQYIDSLGEAKGFDKRINRYSSLLEGRLPLGKVDLVLSEMLNFNLYERYRLGVGVMTNDKLINGLAIGGYWAYGTGDNAHKYGFLVEKRLGKDKFNNITVSYIDDVQEPGRDDMMLGNDFRERAGYRNFLASHMDRVERLRVSSRFRVFDKMQMELFVNQTNKQFLNNYIFNDRFSEGEGLMQSIELLEAGVNVRIAFREKLIRAFGRKLPIEEKGEVLYLSYIKGINQLGYLFDYNKLSLALKYPFNLKRLGKGEVFVHSGYVDADIPMTELFFGAGTNSSKSPILCQAYLSNDALVFL